MVSIGSGLAATSEMACDLCDALGLATIATIQKGHKKKPEKRKAPTSYKERFNRQKKSTTFIKWYTSIKKRITFQLDLKV